MEMSTPPQPEPQFVKPQSPKAGVLSKGGNHRCLVCDTSLCHLSTIHRHWASRHICYVTLFTCPESHCDQKMLRVEYLLNHGGSRHQWSTNQKACIQEEVRGMKRLNQMYRSPKGKVGPDDLRTTLKHKTTSTQNKENLPTSPTFPHTPISSSTPAKLQTPTR